METDRSSFWSGLISSLRAAFGRDGYQKPQGAPEAYASYYPVAETYPQSQHPTTYTLAQLGYRGNELVYACINERSTAVAEAGLQILDNRGETPEAVDEHPMLTLLSNPCPGLNQQEFWGIVETYLLIAGFSAWEKERNNRGEVIALWPMRPDWCKFFRGDGKPIKGIRYAPSGLPGVDIDINDILLFQYFDPLFPLLKGFSPTMAALKIIASDNNLTQLVETYLDNGALLGGMLKTEQSITESEADRIQQRWQQRHAGRDNSGKVVVLGSGVDYKPTQSSIREIEFANLTAHDEARICMTYRVSPILIAAKVGIGAATYNNYREARQAFYERVVQHEWGFLAGNIWEQLLPEFTDRPGDFRCDFDATKVKALQEERSASWAMAQAAAAQGLLTRDEARHEMGYDPIDNAPVFVSTALGAAGAESRSEGQEPVQAPGSTSAEEQEEARRFRSYAKKRIKEGKAADIPGYNFEHTPPERASALVAMCAAPALLEQMSKSIEAIKDDGDR